MMPKQGLLPALFDRFVSYDPNRQAEARAGADLTWPADRDWLDTLAHKIVGPLGLAPDAGERMGNFWARQFPRSTPPSLRERLRGDIGLPSMSALKKSMR